MSKTAVLALVLLAAAAAAPVPAFAAPGPPKAQDAASVQPVSWDLWLAAKAKAEKHDAEGNLVAALQYYLEYARQARGLNSPVRVAWGLNNAAYMIIKMHRQDASVDLEPARRLLEEGLALEGASEDCRKVMAMNLEYVKSCLRSGG
ncbi:MAG: hypothetical protein KA243_08090 [Candidatus Aminicenantes bacterium]|nr:hypothetical protein [Candidatus Aminicenantes bacterium]NLH75837.1 hypothetical protein [Acidobacteriota bacterium]